MLLKGGKVVNGNTIAEIERIIFVVCKGTPHHKKLSLYVVVEIDLLQAVLVFDGGCNFWYRISNG